MSDWQSWDADIAPKNSWTPIGNASQSFVGYFDGRNFTLYGAYVCRPTENSVGLFGQLYRKLSPYIRNLKQEQSFICGNQKVGGIVGSITTGPWPNNVKEKDIYSGILMALLQAADESTFS